MAFPDFHFAMVLKWSLYNH